MQKMTLLTTILLPIHLKKKLILLLTLASFVVLGISVPLSCLAANESNEIPSLGYFPTVEYEKLTKIAEQGDCKEWATCVQKNLVLFFQQMEHSPQDAQKTLEILRHLVCVMKLPAGAPLESNGITFTVRDVVENGVLTDERQSFVDRNGRQQAVERVSVSPVHQSRVEHVRVRVRQ